MSALPGTLGAGTPGEVKDAKAGKVEKVIETHPLQNDKMLRIMSRFLG